MKRLAVVPEHFVYAESGGGNANKARGINLHSYTKNDCRARCRSLLLFGKSIKELPPCRWQIIDIQYFECRKFSFTMNRYSSRALGRRSPLAIVAVSFETFKLFPINTVGTLHSRGSISRVNIGPERPSTLYDVSHTCKLLIWVEILD